MQNTSEDTEWNDVLRAKGIIPPKEEKEITEEQVESIIDSVVFTRTSNEKATEDMSLNELDDLEDDIDEKVFLEYRAKRLAELKATQQAAKYGEVMEITAQDYIKEVNQAGEGVWVILHLYRQGIPLCAVINEHLKVLSRKFPQTKFIKSISTVCIPNYPDRNLPTLFVYRDGQLRDQIVGPLAFGSPNLTQDELEWLLSGTKAITTQLTENPRPRVRDNLFSQLGVSGNQKRNDDSDDENDW